MNLFGGPATHDAAVAHQRFQKPADPGFVDFDAGIATVPMVMGRVAQDSCQCPGNNRLA